MIAVTKHISAKLPVLHEHVACLVVETTKDVLLVHAALDCRVTTLFLLLAVKQASSRGDACFIVQDAAEVHVHLAQWGILSWKRLVSRGSLKIFLSPAGFKLVIFETSGKKRPTLPWAGGTVFAVRCDELLDTSHLAGRRVFAGHLSERGHWWRDHVENEEGRCIVRWPASDVIEAFPDQTDASRKLHPLRERLMELRDDGTQALDRRSFALFSNARLKIRSDKDRLLLSERQRKEAERQVHGVPIVSFELSRLQKRYLAMKRLALQKGRRPWFLLLKYRRGGFTTLEQALSYSLCADAQRAYSCTLAHTKEATRRIFRIVDLFRERDPEAPELVDEDSKTSIEFKNGSYFFIGTAGGLGFGRGDTLQRVHGSEVSKWMENRTDRLTEVDDLVAGLLGAASNGEVVLETTPNGHEWFHQAYVAAKENANEFTPIFVRWFDDPMNVLTSFDESEIVETLTDQEKSLVQRYKLTLAQVAFRRQSKKVYGRLFAQEMPEDDSTCFMSSGVCFFDVSIVTRLMETTPGTKGKERRGGVEHRWKEPKPSVSYVMGVDTSEGLPGGDFAGIGVLQRDTGEQVASLHGLFSPRLLAEHVARMSRIYNNALIGVERQNHGHAVILKLKDLLGVQNGNRVIEWSTDARSRPIMLDELAEAIEEGHMKIHDRLLLDECASFRKQANGKFEADPSAHDDSVMKWAIAWQMRKERKHRVTRGTL